MKPKPVERMCASRTQHGIPGAWLHSLDREACVATFTPQERAKAMLGSGSTCLLPVEWRDQGNGLGMQYWLPAKVLLTSHVVRDGLHHFQYQRI